MYGYRVKNGSCPIFVTYKKKNDISLSTKYEDKFINSKQFSWMTRSRVTLNSQEVVEIKNGLRIPLFVKKSDDEGTKFYYMGEMFPYEYIQTTIVNDKNKILPIVNIKFDMLQEGDERILNYIEE